MQTRFCDGVLKLASWCCCADLGLVVHVLLKQDKQLVELDGWQAADCLERGAFIAPVTLQHGG